MFQLGRFIAELILTTRSPEMYVCFGMMVVS